MPKSKAELFEDLNPFHFRQLQQMILDYDVDEQTMGHGNLIVTIILRARGGGEDRLYVKAYDFRNSRLRTCKPQGVTRSGNSSSRTSAITNSRISAAIRSA